MRWLVLTVLGVLALLNLVFALTMVLRPDELRYGEAILYSQAGRILTGEPLYQPVDQAPYTVAAYTPVYYWLVALLRVLAGPGFWPGRLVSVVSGLVASGLVARLSWRRTGALWPAAAAGLLFAALGLVGPIPWSGSYKEDMLGIALGLGAMTVLDGGPTRRRVVLAACLAALAILTKQTLFGYALAASVWLAYRRPRAAALFASIVLSVVLGVCLSLEATTHAFFANTVLANLNPFSESVLVTNLILLGVFQTGPLLIAGASIVALARLRPARVFQDLVVENWLVSLIPMLGLAKVGSDYNYWLPLAGPTAVLAVSGLWQYRARLRGTWSGFVLGVNAALALALIGKVVAEQPLRLGLTPVAEHGFALLVEQTQAARGAVLADPLDVVVLANRPVVLEPLIYKLLYQSGQWDPTSIVQRVCSGQISLLVLAYPLEDADDHWPLPVIDALRQRLVLDRVVAAGSGQRFVYTLDAGSVCRVTTGRSRGSG